ncbi:hypothetical protein BCV70DRAFT_34592 [Testicularia cyperi]|uniref:Uncharacterized protein n=1 Tax=Testicularia cyperi TaxID=1882483 RepID=A0A317XLD8_9BASI|nr:hypothetical protein BCV70DRAFT_34592 [Testicularia cyperi]
MVTVQYCAVHGTVLYYCILLYYSILFCTPHLAAVVSSATSISQCSPVPLRGLHLALPCPTAPFQSSPVQYCTKYCSVLYSQYPSVLLLAFRLLVPPSPWPKPPSLNQPTPNSARCTVLAVLCL